MAIQIQTAHNVAIEFETSTVWKRTMGFTIDIIVIGIWMFFGSIIAASLGIGAFDSWDGFGVLYYLLVIIPIMIYDLVFETLNNGQTIGKAIMGMRVVTIKGARPSFSAYFIRWLFRPFDIIMSFGMLAFVMIGFTKKSQRLGDLLAGTTVIDMKVAQADQSLMIDNLNFKDEYKVTYPNILALLTDKDIQIIVSVLRDANNGDSNNSSAATQLADKIVEVTGYVYDKGTIGGVNNYLNTIINDYHYLVTRS